MKVKFSRKNFVFLGVYLFFFAFVLCTAISIEAGSIIFRILTILTFGIFLFEGNGTHVADLEKITISLGIMLFNALMLLHGRMQGQHEIFNSVCAIALIFMTVIYFICNHNGVYIKKWFVENGAIVLVIVCFSLLSIEVIDSWLMWDAWQYYAGWDGSIKYVTKIFDADFSGVYNLYLAGHAAIGYSLWIIFFQMIKEGVASVQIADIILAGISIFSYYQILRKLLGERYSNGVLALATLPYACSPFVLGIVGNVNIDSATMYFAIIFLACLMYQFECLELVLAVMFCFTKETAVIYYVAYIVAKVICEYIFHSKIKLWELLKFGFGNIKNYIYALPVILWGVLYKLNLNGSWGGEEAALWDNKGWNCFGFSQYVVPTKLKQIFFMNFNWVFWLAIVLGIILIYTKKNTVRREVLEKLIPVCIMGVAVILFGCLYITYVLPRYIVPLIPVLYLAATVIMGDTKKRLFCGWNVIVSVLLLIQCVNVIDPMMKSMFPSIPTGYGSNERMYKVGNEERLDDHIVYNRQNIFWSETIRYVLGRAGYNGDMLIVFPDTDAYDARYCLLGNPRCLWNTETKEVEYYIDTQEFPAECKWLETCYVSDAEQTLSLRDNNYILYIVPRFTDINFEFVSDKKILKQGEVEHRGYSVEYMVLRAEDNLPLNSGNYIVSPKQESSLGLCSDGAGIYLSQETMPINVSGLTTKYNFIFDEYQVAMDVQGDRADENGTVWVWEINRGHAQQWSIERIDDYYMICWDNYALTYDLSNNSIRIMPKTGEDNQLWVFTI